MLGPVLNRVTWGLFLGQGSTICVLDRASVSLSRPTPSAQILQAFRSWFNTRRCEGLGSTYFPNTVYFMSRCGCLAYVMKNWEPLVSGPLLAIDTVPRALCCSNATATTTKFHSHSSTTTLSQPFNPFTPDSDQCQISPAASQEIWHHTVRRTWLIIAYSDERWL